MDSEKLRTRGSPGRSLVGDGWSHPDHLGGPVLGPHFQGSHTRHSVSSSALQGAPRPHPITASRTQLKSVPASPAEGTPTPKLKLQSPDPPGPATAPSTCCPEGDSQGGQRGLGGRSGPGQQCAVPRPARPCCVCSCVQVGGGQCAEGPGPGQVGGRP